MRLILFFILTSLLLCNTVAIAQNNKSLYDGSFIQFHLYGKGEPVFVLSGGPGNNCFHQEDVAIKLGEKYQAILLEQRGTGLSMPKELNSKTINLAAYLQDIIYVMDSLKIKKARFYGHSWGVHYALAFALEHPERVASIVGVSPGYLKFDSKLNKQLYEIRMSKLTTVQRKQYNTFAKKNPDKLSESELQEFANLRALVNVYDTTNQAWKFAKILRSNPTDQTNKLMNQDLEKINFNLRPNLKSLQMPICIITCKEDAITSIIPDFKEYIPNAEIIWMNHCGHYPMFEKPEEFYPKLMEVIAK